MFFPHDAELPGSCISVFARSIGFVTSTDAHEATAEFGRDTHCGSGSFVELLAASRLETVSVLVFAIDVDVDAFVATLPRGRGIERGRRGGEWGNAVVGRRLQPARAAEGNGNIRWKGSG